MAGALNRGVRRYRRHYDDGGAVTEQDAAMPPPIVTDPGSGDFIPPDLLPPTGAVSRGMAEPPGNDNGPPITGAVTRGMVDPDAARKLQQVQAGIQMLTNPNQPTGNGANPKQDMENTMSVLQAAGMGGGLGATNLPLLAAAGALMSPTRSGTIGESLGKAMTEGATVAEQERQRMESAALRMQQAIWQNDYRQQMGAAATSRASTYGQIAGSRQESADAMMLRAQTGAATAQERLALAEATNAERAGKGTWQATEGTDPDTGQRVPGMAFLPTGGGKPTFFPQVAQSKALTSQQNADTATDRANTGATQGQEKIDQGNARIAIQNRAADLKAQGLDEKTANDQATQEYHNGMLGVAQQNAGTNETRATTSATQGQERIDQGGQRVIQGRQRIDQNQARLDWQKEYQAQELALRDRGLDQQAIDNVMNNASSAVRNDVTGNLTLHDAVQQQLNQRPAPKSPQQPTAPPSTPPPGLPQGAKLAPDGQWYVPNPNGGWLRAVPGNS